MRFRNALKLSASAIATLAVGGVMVAGSELAAQQAQGPLVFNAPEEVCTWDWGTRTSPYLLRALNREAVLEESLRYMAENCPATMCEIQWGGYSVPAEFWEGEEITEEMLLWLRVQPFFDEVMEEVAATCPDVALLMVEGATAAGGDGPGLGPFDGDDDDDDSDDDDDDTGDDDDDDDDDDDERPWRYRWSYEENDHENRFHGRGNH